MSTGSGSSNPFKGDQAVDLYFNWLWDLTYINRSKGLLPKQHDGVTPIDIGLKDIYVPLKVRKCTVEEQQDDLVEWYQATEGDRIPNKYDSDEELSLTKSRFRKARGVLKHVKEKVPIEELRKEQRIILIGGVGSGKTTFCFREVNKLCEAYAADHSNPIPVLLAFRDLAELASNSKLPEAENFPSFVLGKTLGGMIDADSGFLEDAMQSGKAVLFFDGLDELPDMDTRQITTSWLQSIVNEYPRNRYIITSRPTGYLQSPLSGDNSHYEIAPFDDEQINLFIEQWYPLVENRVGGDSAFTKSIAAQQVKSVKAAMDAKQEIRDLACNPLLLTLIVVVHRYRGQLPDRVSVLYEECLGVLLSYWPKQRLKPLPVQFWQSTIVLKRIAYAMHCKRNRDTNRQHLITIIKDQLEKLDPDLDANQFFQKICLDTMVMEERGTDAYGFYHLSFQEYLAACYIRENNKIDELAKNLHHTHFGARNWWIETAKLFCGLNDQWLNYRLLDTYHNLEDDEYKSNFFLLCRLLPHCPVPPKNCEVILDQLVGYFTGQDEFLFQRAAEVLSCFHNRPYDGRLIELIRNKERYIDALSLIGSAKAQDELITLLQQMQNEYVFSSIANALGRLGYKEAVKPLLAKLEQTQNEHVFSSIAYALGRLGDKEAVKPLLAKLEQTQNEDAISSIADALGRLGAQEAIKPLLAKLEQTQSIIAVSSIAEALGSLGAQEAVDPLLAKLEQTQSKFAISNISNALRKLDADKAVKHLLTMLDQGPAEEIIIIALALGSLGAQEAVNPLLAKLEQTNNPNSISSIAYALGRLCDKESVKPLLAKLEQTQNEDAISSIADALGSLGAQEAVNPLLAKLEQTNNPNSISSIANALGSLGAQEAVKPLLAKLEQTQNEYVIRATAHALGKLGANEATNLMLNQLRNIKSPHVHINILFGVLDIYEKETKAAGTSDNKIRDKLMQTISDLKEKVFDSRGPLFFKNHKIFLFVWNFKTALIWIAYLLDWGDYAELEGASHSVK